MDLSDDDFIYDIKGDYTNKSLIENVTDYIEYIQYLVKKWHAKMFWYRGVHNSTYDLEPKIYRAKFIDYSPSIADTLYHLFEGKSKAYTEKELTKWGCYFAMQHYGMPTRLLDWTESALIALYFALNKKELQEPTVWILVPYELNIAVRNKDRLFYLEPKKESIEDEKELGKYLNEGDDLPEYPIAILPSHIDHRITAQKSMFTIHGKKKDGINRMELKNVRIAKLRFNADYSKGMRVMLYTLGITESVLFPDFEGISRELQQIYCKGYEWY